MTGILDLPVELLLPILDNLTESHDLSSLSQCSRGVYAALSDRLFSLAFNRRLKSQSPESVVSQLFLHAAKYDSRSLIRWLIFREYGSYLRGFVPVMKNVTYLHYAILQDAPHVATQLVKYGTDIYEDEFDYPDLTPLYLAIARPRYDICGSLDGALRIACSYALPRTAKFLLTRGADPNSLSSFGFAAVHLCTMRRLPWNKFKALSWLNDIKDSESVLWAAKVLQTADALLHFGADPNLASSTSRLHACGHMCWRSLDCVHCGQRVLHFAAASGNEDVVKLLLEKGADPRLADEEGYLPPFAAMSQGHGSIATLLLRRIRRRVNPVISKSKCSTALHVACRFALPELVHAMLKRGADPNVIDSLGQTPLHEALGQDAPQLEEEVVDTLYHLASRRASPDLVDLEKKSARQMGEKHAFQGVREMFEFFGKSQLFVHEALFEKPVLPEAYETRPTRSEHMAGQFTVYGERNPMYQVTEEVEYPGALGEEKGARKGRTKGRRKAPTWEVKESFPRLPAVVPKHKDSSSLSEKTQKAAQPEGESTAKSQRTKGGRKKKWTPLAL